MRVVAGTAGGRRLSPPPTGRPTTERVREAVFASLGAFVVDATVLDLYAGSGALAIEALSRGAARAVVVDDDRGCADVCVANLDRTGLADRARVRRSTVEHFLAGPPAPEAPFDLVLLDPPYEPGVPTAVAALAALAASPGWLAPGARAIVEGPVPRGRDAPEPQWPEPWVVVWARRYGDTLVTALSVP